ncbi:MAG: glycerophosphodiester phosphodiesterase family protein [Desulfocapsaceae bacterium]|nr:glycerophosphodiester phosphodiesterase family protein [Desulfocapsaceae bacterium]
MPTAAHYNIAHRGARSLVPENTMAAFHKAWQLGAHGIETDISVSGDGQLLLFHDDTLQRTSNVAQLFPSRKDKALASFDWLELQQLDVGSWFVDTDPFKTIADGQINSTELHRMHDLRIPLLSELLTFVKEKSWFVNLEIKPLPHAMADFPVVETTLELIDKAGLAHEHFSISSFYHPFLHKVQELRPDIEINALIGGEIGRKQSWGNYEFAIYNGNVRLTDRKQILQARQHGCRINLYTVNDPKEMIYFLSLGVEKIITDFPQLLAEINPENWLSAGTGDKTL